jgi:hypothetical protein
MLLVLYWLHQVKAPVCLYECFILNRQCSVMTCFRGLHENLFNDMSFTIILEYKDNAWRS